MVTGGASGLGKAVVERLYGRGYNVAILDIPSSKGAEVASQLGDRAIFTAADVRKRSQTSDTFFSNI
jgi:NAD(P)-dependent dehydrogenase (short-subunit alcohol dehydrogenase family)